MLVIYAEIDNCKLLFAKNYKLMMQKYKTIKLFSAEIKYIFIAVNTSYIIKIKLYFKYF